jgi:peptidylprolyl isomerase
MKNNMITGAFLSAITIASAALDTASQSNDPANNSAVDNVKIDDSVAQPDDANKAVKTQNTPEIKVEEKKVIKVENKPSGLICEFFDEGTGNTPKTGDTVAVHYTGRLENGMVFDSSHNRGTPFEFALGTGMVIKGWDEGIAMLKEGGSARLTIPAGIGYGSRDLGSIPPNSTLIFDVDLVQIKPLKKRY